MGVAAAPRNPGHAGGSAGNNRASSSRPNIERFLKADVFSRLNTAAAKPGMAGRDSCQQADDTQECSQSKDIFHSK
jgi:hypothetical protein